MILSTIGELRFYIPNHALDNIESIQGSIYNSEHDFLEDKLGTQLYDAVCAYYKELTADVLINTAFNGDEQSSMMQLLLAAQRAVAFDAMARSISIRAISDNGGGVNVAESDNYKAADDKSKNDYRLACIKEAHTAVNITLKLLERWCQELETASTTGSSSTTTGETANALATNLTKKEIVALWKKSRYYYLCTSVLLPSADELQQYLNIYDSREKYIQMLPDLKYVEEELIEPAVGETFAQWLCLLCVYGIPSGVDAASSRALERIIHRLRKAFAVYTEERTNVLSTTKERRMAAHAEGDKHITASVDMLRLKQTEYETAAAAIDALKDVLDAEDIVDTFTDAVKNAPWYMPATQASTAAPEFENNKDGDAIFVTPAMN